MVTVLLKRNRQRCLILKHFPMRTNVLFLFIYVYFEFIQWGSVVSLKPAVTQSETSQKPCSPPPPPSSHLPQNMVIHEIKCGDYKTGALLIFSKTMTLAGIVDLQRGRTIHERRWSFCQPAVGALMFRILDGIESHAHCTAATSALPLVG